MKKENHFFENFRPRRALKLHYIYYKNISRLILNTEHLQECNYYQG